MSVLIKVFDSHDYLNNVIAPLSLDLKRVIFITHDTIPRKHKEAAITLLDHKGIDAMIVELKDDEKEIENLFRTYPEAIVDISSDRYLNFYIFERAIRDGREVIYFDNRENVIKDYRTHTILKKDLYHLDIAEMIYLAGGTIKTTLHEAPDMYDKDYVNKIKMIIQHVIDDYGHFTNFISKTMQILKGEIKVSLSKKQKNSLINSDYYQLFRDLDIVLIQNNTLKIDPRFKTLLTNAGSWLESYLYITIKESGDFDDCIMSATIDFSDRDDIYPVICEIDAIVALANRLAFISCKSNRVSTEALNEIKVHRHVFGSETSKAVIFTADDLNIKNPPIFKKAQELSVAVIDKTTIENRSIALVMKKILSDTYRYERVS